MDYSDPPHYANNGRAVAGTLIKASREDALDAVATDLGTAFGLQVTGTYTPRTDSRPAWGVWSVGEWIWAFIEGCSTLGHGLATAAGYTGTPVPSNRPARNDYLFDIAARVATEIRTRPGYQTARIRFVGHSLGGGVAEAAALTIKPEVTVGRCAVITFGAPKFGNLSDCEAVSAFTHARWMNEDDPVPLVFPTPRDNPAIALAFGVPQLVRIGVFTQPAGGLEITAAGRIRGNTYPQAAAVDAVTNIAAWLVNIDREVNTPHDLPEYIHRFNLFLYGGVLPSEQPRASMHIERPEEADRRTVTHHQGQIIRQVRDQEQEQRAAKLRIPPRQLVTVRRSFGLYIVRWGDNVLSVVTRKKTALRCKNVCNAFLNTLLRMGIVEPDTVLSQMREFMQQAQTPASGITPQLKTSLPGGV